MTIHLTDAEKARMFDALVSEGAINVEQLMDLTRCMERELHRMVALREPVWTNPTTGKNASSVHAAFNALGFFTSKHWSAVANAARGFASFHERRDLPKANRVWATICLDLADIETLVVKLAPRKGKRVITEFKASNGLA